MTTALLAVCLMLGVNPSADQQASINFLRTMQTASGGFISVRPPSGPEPMPSLRTTRTGLRVLRLLGGEPADRDAVIRFLKACHDPQSGGFSDRPGLKPDAISTSVALMILGELKLPVEPYLEPGLKFMNDQTEGFEQVRMVASGLEELDRSVPNSIKWLKEIAEVCNPDGSYGKGPGSARTTALFVVAQQRLGGKPESEQVVLKVLRAGQRADGGFGGDQDGASDLEACYRIVRLFSRLSAMPDNPTGLTAYIASCRHADGGYGIRPGDPSSLHGTYYATIVTHWLAGGK